MEYNYAVFVGRFQPFHVGHLRNIQKALSIAEKLIIIVGSAYCAPNIKNPFSYELRKKMIMADLVLADIDKNRIIIEPVTDWFYDENGWKNEVQEKVYKHAAWQEKIAIIGHQKDASSYYLKCFPRWQHVDVDNFNAFNATCFRRQYFVKHVIEPQYMISPDSDKGSYHYVAEFMQSSLFTRLCEEYQVIDAYQKSWEKAPFAPIFVTVDAMVIVNNKLLLIKRKYAPGKELWAFPGGFLDQEERIFDGIIRELVEETQVAISRDELKKCHVETRVFDYPERSLRGRTITHVGLFIQQTASLPHIQADDDAEVARWVDLEEVYQYMSDKLMDDHYQIIRNMLHRHKLLT
ncbi:bifunctional nicotinamide-nucleotide adenylyltransferase/Nudix hydroxylase [Facilibium subflavum]|uniref:bifunctional nicotinamide-nucleotide adenylyltransferase/Nudix hydroxylase n=1 Tax=Facilibium subflavum TaxID=2219058 RepID=UPI000E650E2D|nr:bifunctional nicotinamide-nucleotide adenylyltransferase/Nudix hydroxylase [Facilibium subflavum]